MTNTGEDTSDLDLSQIGEPDGLGVDGSASVSVFAALLAEARAVVGEMRLAAKLGEMTPPGLCPIFYRDTVIKAALPWANADSLQRRLLATHAPLDDLLLTQVIDLVPSLAGAALVDVGSFTGSTAFFLRAFQKPAVTHLFEPQAIMQEALNAAIASNDPSLGPVILHRDVIDEEGQTVEIGSTTPSRLHQTRYLRREGGPIRARGLDALDLGRIGLLNLDFPNDKVPALRGGLATIARDRPVILMDLAARDIGDVRELLLPLGYRDIRIGRNSTLFFPE